MLSYFNEPIAVVKFTFRFDGTRNGSVAGGAVVVAVVVGVVPINLFTSTWSATKLNVPVSDSLLM